MYAKFVLYNFIKVEKMSRERAGEGFTIFVEELHQMIQDLNSRETSDPVAGTLAIGMLKKNLIFFRQADLFEL